MYYSIDENANLNKLNTNEKILKHLKKLYSLDDVWNDLQKKFNCFIISINVNEYKDDKNILDFVNSLFQSTFSKII